MYYGKAYLPDEGQVALQYPISEDMLPTLKIALDRKIMAIQKEN
jgi:hypothetical protein